MANIHKITWKGKEHNLCLAAIARLTDKSATFLKNKLQEGISIQEAILLTPNDPANRQPRRKSVDRGGRYTHSGREKREESYANEHKDLIDNFLRGALFPRISK